MCVFWYLVSNDGIFINFLQRAHLKLWLVTGQGLPEHDRHTPLREYKLLVLYEHCGEIRSVWNPGIQRAGCCEWKALKPQAEDWLTWFGISGLKLQEERV